MKARLVPITYFIDQTGGGVWPAREPLKVKGFAFETPGWPKFHACVRFDRRPEWEHKKAWIMDHYESGLGLSGAGKVKRKEDAPNAVAKLLTMKGRREVAAALRKISLPDAAKR